MIEPTLQPAPRSTTKPATVGQEGLDDQAE